MSRGLPVRVAFALLLPVLLAGAVASQANGVASSVAADGRTVDRGLGTPAGPPLEGAALDAATEDLASELRCPVCQGLSVADSPSESARAMQSEIRELLADGYSRQQVEDYFVDAYGEFVLLLPKPRGLNLVVWLLPVLALLAGVALVLRSARSRRPRGTAAESEADGELEDYLRRVRTDAAQPEPLELRGPR